MGTAKEPFLLTNSLLEQLSVPKIAVNMRCIFFCPDQQLCNQSSIHFMSKYFVDVLPMYCIFFTNIAKPIGINFILFLIHNCAKINKEVVRF